MAFIPPGRLDAVVTGSTGSLYVSSRPTASQAWTGWLNMAGSAIGRPAVVSASGYLDMYAHGTDGALWNRYRRPDDSRSAWRNLGAVQIAATAGLIATSTSDGRHLVVARDGDGSLLLLTRTLSSGQLAITDLGGGLLTDPTVTSARAGRATIALLGTNDDLYIREVTGAAVGGGSTWVVISVRPPWASRMRAARGWTSSSTTRRARCSGGPESDQHGVRGPSG